MSSKDKAGGKEESGKGSSKGSSKGSKGSKGSKKEQSPRPATRRSALKSASKKGDTTRRARLDLSRNKETLFKGRPTDDEVAQLWQTDDEFKHARRERDYEQRLEKGELQTRRDKALRKKNVEEHFSFVAPAATKEINARKVVIQDAARKGMSKQLYQEVAREAAHRAAIGPGLRSARSPRRSRRSASREDGFIILRRQPGVTTNREPDQPIERRSAFKAAYDFFTYPFTRRRRGGKKNRNTRNTRKNKK
jgi:hypothetical protein